MSDQSPKPVSDIADQIMQFRNAYLRAVARATVDLKFRQALTNGYCDPLCILRNEFGYKCPWNVRLVVRDKPDQGPRLNPADGVIMTRPYVGELIILYIPKPPDPDSDSDYPKKLMDALASYYNEHCWVFNDKGLEGSSDSPNPKDTDQETPPNDWLSTSMLPRRTERFDLGTAIDDLLSFGAAMFNAVALAWSNATFMQLLTDPHAPTGRTIKLLKEWIGYEFPGRFELRVRLDDKAKYDVGALPNAWKWQIKSPTVVLTLPWMTGALTDKEETELNRSRPGVAVMGLALYNTDGPGYPFTCG